MTKSSHINEAINAFQETLSNRTSANLDDIASLSEKFIGIKGNEFLGIKDKPKEPPKPIDSKSFKLSEIKDSNLREFRELVETEKSKKSGFRVSYEDVKKSDKVDGWVCNSNKPQENEDAIKLRDPRTSSNMFQTFNISDDETVIGGSGKICIEMDTEEAQVEIIKNTQTHLGRQLVQAIDMRVLDDIAKETYQLEGELRTLSALKFDTFASLDQSLNDAERALKLERASQIVKYLEELIKHVPEDFLTLAPEDQKSFRDANNKLCKARELFVKQFGSAIVPGASDKEIKIEDGIVFKNAKESVIDATLLWPRFKEMPRMIHLIDKILNIAE